MFCQIDESLFAPLYSGDNGRPNFPVNIFVGLEIIKHLRNYTDEVLFDEYAVNYQISYALGLRTLGERYFAPRTFYEFRTRLYKYSQEFPEKADLIYQQFQTLTDRFIQLANLNTDEGRTDSMQIMSNIKQAGRLSLAYDVLTQGIKSIPEHLLSESLKVFLKPNYKTEFLHKVKTSELGSKIQMLINYCAELLQVVEGNHESKNPEIQLVKLFIHQQRADFNEKTKTLSAHFNLEICKQCPRKDICRVKFQKRIPCFV